MMLRRASRLAAPLARVSRRTYASEVTTQKEFTELQAPNRAETWAPSQRPRKDAMKGPRFEQRDMELQPRPYAAIDLIAQEPVRYLDAHSAVCDGGHGAQGHPKIYINLDKPGSHACLYCTLLSNFSI